MALQSITPVASTSTAPDNAITNVQSESTERQTINIKKKKDEVNYNLATWWLRMVEPRRAPYFPQKKDKIVYLRQAHEYYLKEVIDRKIFDVKESDKLWLQMNILDYEYLTVVDVSFERYNPTRVACLKVIKCIKETVDTDEPVFELKYHDMEGVVDFLVLKHIFDEGLVTEWNVGDPFRYLIDNMWFSGTIVSIKPNYQKSPFQSFQIMWDDDGELDQMSPWEIQRINENRLPENHGEPVEVDPTEIEKMRYEPCPNDWPIWEDWKATIKNIIREFDLLMGLPISKCFIEIKNDPIYDALVPYLVDLSTIRERIYNHFYRRIDALHMDIDYLKNNAKEHKSEKFFKEAKFIAEACLEILYTGETNQVELSKNILSIESDDDNEYKIFGSLNQKEDELSYKDDWMVGCTLLLNILGDSEDMYPFRQPVSREDYPDYYKEISSPICFEEINTKFYSNRYKSQKEVFEDIELIISNSYKFNQVEESAIYCATEAVEALFKELKKQINSKKESSRKKNKSIPSRREKQKISIRKQNEEIVAQQLEPINRKSSNQDENIVDETETHSKNNNTKNLSKALSANGSDINLARIVCYVQTPNLTETKQNKGKENKCSKKENMQKQDSMKRKQLQFKNEHNYNESPKKKLHTSTVEINTKYLLYETHFVNSNEEDRMEVVEGNNKTNNSNNSGFYNNDCKIIENNCTDQFNNEPKSPQILQSQTEDSLDSLNLQVSDDEHGHQEATTSYKKEAVLTQSPNHSTENGDKCVNMSLQNNYNEDLSKASSTNGDDTNLAVQTLDLAIIQIKEEINEVKKEIFRQEDSMNRYNEVVQSVNEKTSNESSKKNVDNDDCEIIGNDCADQFNNEPKSSQISQLQRTDSIDSIVVIDSDIDNDEEYGKVIKRFGKADDPTHSQTHSTADTNKDVIKCLQEQSNFKSSLASIKENSMNANEDEEKRQKVTKSSIKTGDFYTHLQAHFTESKNQINVEPEPSNILQSQIEISTDSFELQDIKEEQEHQDLSKNCNKVDLIQSPNHSIENRDKGVNKSLQSDYNGDLSNASSANGADTNFAVQTLNLAIIQIKEEEINAVKKKIFKEEGSIKREVVQSVNEKTSNENSKKNVDNDDCEIIENDCTEQLQRTDSIYSIVVIDSDIDDDEEYGNAIKNFGKAEDSIHSQAHSTVNTNKDVNKCFQVQSNFKSSLASTEANSMNVNANEEKRQKVTKSCTKTGDFNQLQAHCTESTNQYYLKPEPSCILQSQIEVSIVESVDLEDIKEEQEHQEPPQNRSNVDVAQSQNNSVENRDKDANYSSLKKSNVTKSLASIKANSINMNDDKEMHQIVTQSCIKTEDFTQTQSHCIESTNQINVEPEPSYILQSQVGVSTESDDVQDIKEEQEYQDPPKSCNTIDLTQSHNHSTESRDKDVNDSSQKNSNVKKSRASFKARKRMKLKYNRIFQHRPHKSCDLCQSIRRTYLVHLKSHHRFNTS